VGGADRLRGLRAQRLGDDDVGRHAQGGAGEPGQDPGRVGALAQGHPPRQHRPAGRRDLEASGPPAGEREGGRALEDPDAGGLGGGGEAVAQAQRVEVEAVRVEEAVVVARRAVELAQARPRPELEPRAEGVVVARDLGRQPAGVVEPGRHHDARRERHARGQGAAPQQLQPVDAEAEQLAGPARSDRGLEGVRVAREPGRRHPAVAARGAGAHPARLEQDRRLAALGQRERQAQAREPAADDAGVGLDGAGERRPGRRRPAAGGLVVGLDCRPRAGHEGLRRHGRPPGLGRRCPGGPARRRARRVGEDRQR
jgi:hypothetical protein